MALNQYSTFGGEQQRLAFTMKRWLKTELTDHFWNNHPLWVKLRDKQNILTGGLGEELVVNLRYPDANNPTPRGVTNPLTTSGRNVLSGATRLKVPTAQIVFNFSVDKREIRLQGSETKKADYLAGQLTIAKDQWQFYMMNQIWAEEDTLGGAGAEDRLASIRVLMNKGGASTSWLAGPTPHPAQGGSTGVVPTWVDTMGATAAARQGKTPITKIGNIDRNLAGAVNFCVPTWYPATVKALSLVQSSINDVWLASTINSQSADFAVTSREYYALVMSILQKQQTLQPSMLQKYGFQAFNFNGVDWIFDDNMPGGIESNNASYSTASSQLFFINTSNLQIQTDAAEPTVTTVQAVDAPVYDYQWEWYGQLVPLHLGRGLGSRCTAMKHST